MGSMAPIDPSAVGPGELGLVLLLALGAGTAAIGFALRRSMRTLETRVPPGEPPPEDGAPDAGSPRP